MYLMTWVFGRKTVKLFDVSMAYRPWPYKQFSVVTLLILVSRNCCKPAIEGLLES